MRKLLHILLCLTLAFSWSEVSAQCPGCTPDPGCIDLMPGGGLCPSALPNATVGQAYDENITFYIPFSFTDPGTGTAVQINQATIASVSGLPTGLDWECNNDATGCNYYPSGSDPTAGLGCAKICGTASVVPGTYVLTITAIAQVYVPSFGVNLTVPQEFDTQIVVEAPASGTASYSADFVPDCGDNVLVEYHAILDGAPDYTTWNWTFGNGNTSASADPPLQSYDSPGTYDVELTTSFYKYKVNSVCINSLNDNWCGDVEEINWPLIGCTADPDVAFILRDAMGNQIYQSSVKEGTSGLCWNNINVLLSNPAYSIEIYDLDGLFDIFGWTIGSDDDDLGTFTWNPDGPGNLNFSGAGGTSGYFDIGLQLVQEITDSSQVFAIADPLTASFEVTDNTEVGGYVGAIDMTVSGGTPPYEVFWSNGSMMQDISGLTSGEYTVLIEDANGCEFNGSALIEEPENLPCNESTIVSGVLAVPTASGSAVTLSWASIPEVDFYNGKGRRAGTTPFGSFVTSNTVKNVGGLLPATTYEFKIRARCASGAITSFSPLFSFTTNQAPKLSNEPMGSPVEVELHPNPTSGLFSVNMELNSREDVNIRIIDNLGRLIQEENVEGVEGSFNKQFDLSGYSAGLYFVNIQTGSESVVKKVILN